MADGQNQAMVEARCAQIALLMEEKLGARGADLAEKVRRAGRRVPHRIRRKLHLMVDAQEAEAPQDGDFDRAYRDVHRYLDRMDVGKLRARRRSALIANIAVQMLIVTGLVIVVLNWRGFL